jgi:hypothetical protein
MNNMKKIISYNMLLLVAVKAFAQTTPNNTDTGQNKKLVTVMNDLFNKKSTGSCYQIFF